jgi:hypothetical protein
LKDSTDDDFLAISGNGLPEYERISELCGLRCADVWSAVLGRFSGVLLAELLLEGVLLAELLVAGLCLAAVLLAGELLATLPSGADFFPAALLAEVSAGLSSEESNGTSGGLT